MLALALSVMACGSASATADGPDFYMVQGAPDGVSLALQAAPGGTNSGAALPVGTTCVRNRGCQGGLTQDEFTNLSEEERVKRIATNPRWCKVEYHGNAGWVEGKFLTEGPCSGKDVFTNVLDVGTKTQKVRGTITGGQNFYYRISALAGQTLSVNLKAKHPQTYFNITPLGSQAAMFIGSSSGNQSKTLIPADGDYSVQVYLMRAAARRGATSAFTLSVALDGRAIKPIAPSKDALVAGTPFHATARVACSPPFSESVTSCFAGVIRRGFDGTATVQVRWPQGARNILFVKGTAVASDSAQKMSSTRINEATRVMLGADEAFEIPDVLINGG